MSTQSTRNHASRNKFARVSQSTSLLSIQETADALNISRDTVRRLISKGELRALKIGRQIRIRPQDLDRACKPVTSQAALRQMEDANRAV